MKVYLFLFKSEERKPDNNEINSQQKNATNSSKTAEMPRKGNFYEHDNRDDDDDRKHVMAKEDDSQK